MLQESAVISQSTERVLTQINGYIQRYGLGYSQWICGTTDDWQSCLFGSHRISVDSHPYIVRQCVNSEAAWSTRQELINLGCRGVAEKPDDGSVYVYAYLKAAATRRV